jgi:hypothetical protein
MARFALSLLVLLASLSARAADPPPNSLTPEEIAQGWVLLFDGKTTFGWTSPNDSKWTIADGMLAPQKGKAGFLVTTTTFSDFELSFEVNQSEKSTLEVITCSDVQGQGRVKFPYQPWGVRYVKDRWARYRVKVQGGHALEDGFESPDGKFLETLRSQAYSKPKESFSGFITLKGSEFGLRNIKLKPLDMGSLFNRKDLEGWKEHPDRKSKFGVTKEGWLSVKDGPGDLQTVKEWDDFVLQLECKTNGKHLNSGVFFRCLPGQYQQGYEAQIHNGFGPEKEYALDVFDPQTHNLVEKRKEKYTALDYGTGAIYRRQPARFQAARDNEWFTMTVVAQGRHFATWVNGLQVVDWTDHRPLAENARQGAYLKKGPISLQGHDPTTDLLFRNLRIAELPAK